MMALTEDHHKAGPPALAAPAAQGGRGAGSKDGTEAGVPSAAQGCVQAPAPLQSPEPLQSLQEPGRVNVDSGQVVAAPVIHSLCLCVSVSLSLPLPPSLSGHTHSLSDTHMTRTQFEALCARLAKLEELFVTAQRDAREAAQSFAAASVSQVYACMRACHMHQH